MPLSYHAGRVHLPRCPSRAAGACHTSCMAPNPLAGLDWRRWFDRMLPQTLQIALWLLYMDGVFALLDYLDGARDIYGWSRLLGGAGGIVAPLAVIPLAIVAGSLWPGGWIFSTKNLQPKLERFNPLSNLGRLVSGKHFSEFGLSLFKVGVLLAVLFLVVLFWDTHRLAVLGLLSAAFLAAGTVALFGIRRRLAQRPRLFSRTLEELARDRRELES